MQALLRCRELHAPDSALAADELACADLGYGVVGQFARSHALAVYVRAMVGELEVKVGKAKLAAGSGQVGGIGGDDVQEESPVGVVGGAGGFEVC